MNGSEGLLAAWPIVGMFIGDLLKRLKLNDWLIPINMSIGGILACLMLEGAQPGASGWTLPNFFIGMAIGSGASGLHGLRKTVKKAGGGQ
jgi:hypothetical protein